MFQTPFPATKETIQHYRRKEVRDTILRICHSNADTSPGYRWIVGNSEYWYKYIDGRCYANKGAEADYSKLTLKCRTLHYTIGSFSNPVFEDLTDIKGTEALTELSKKNCTSYTALFDIDTIDEVNGHGTNIEQPEVKAAVEKMVKFVCDDLKKYAPGSYYAAFSGGGAYILLHHAVFQDYIDEIQGDPAQVEKIDRLSDGINAYIIDLVKRFREAFPEEGKYVKIDAINQAKRQVKTLLSVHKKKPYAVIPLDTESPVIDFEAAKLPLSIEVLEASESWYSSGQHSPEFMEMLKVFMEQAKKQKIQSSTVWTSNEEGELVFYDIKKAVNVDDFPPCIINILRRPHGGEGATRALAFLAAFLGTVQYDREEAHKMWLEVANRWNAPTTNIFQKWYPKMFCPSCRTLNTPGSEFPHINAVAMKLCKPDARCLNVRRTNPAYVASNELYLESFKRRHFINKVEHSKKTQETLA